MNLKTMIQNYNPVSIIRKKLLRKKLSKKNITILSSNCLGGLLYNELGLQFLSPTVNLRFTSTDFVKFILDIEKYLDADFNEVTSEETYPVAKLEDIMVHFVHYHTFEDAIKTWRRRRERINWDNVYIILNDCDGLSEEHLSLLDKSSFKNIVVFTSKKDWKYKCSFYLPRYDNEPCVGNLMAKNPFTGMMTGEKDFDFVSWFNQSRGDALDDYRR